MYVCIAKGRLPDLVVEHQAPFHRATGETIDEDDADDAAVREGLLRRVQELKMAGLLSFQRHTHFAHEGTCLSLSLHMYIYIYIYMYVPRLRHCTCTDTGEHKHAAIHGHTVGKAM